MDRVILLVNLPKAGEDRRGGFFQEFYLVPEKRFNEVFVMIGENKCTNSKERHSGKEMIYHMFCEARSPWRFGDWEKHNVQIVAAYDYEPDVDYED